MVFSSSPRPDTLVRLFIASGSPCRYSERPDGQLQFLKVQDPDVRNQDRCDGEDADYFDARRAYGGHVRAALSHRRPVLHAKDDSIVASLSGKKMDVLVMKGGKSETLKNVLTFLKTSGFLYPNILCVFCRVSAEQFEGNAYIGGSTTGKVHAFVSQANQHKVN